MPDKIKIMILIMFFAAFLGSELKGQIRRSIYSDIKANKVGDIITILISEQTSSANKSETSTRKDNQMQIDNKAGTGFLDFLPGLGASSKSNNRYQGTAQIISSGQFSARISARIQKILEDGNYLIRGVRVLDINGEKLTTEITGVVRPQDITSDNTILSSMIADVQINHIGTGVIQQGNRPGFFTRIINWLF